MVILPVDWSVNWTVNGAGPLVGLAEKAATGSALGVSVGAAVGCGRFVGPKMGVEVRKRVGTGTNWNGVGCRGLMPVEVSISGVMLGNSVAVPGPGVKPMGVKVAVPVGMVFCAW